MVRLVQLQRLLQGEQVLVTPVALQRPRDLGLGALATFVPQLGQLTRVAFAAQDCLADGQSGETHHIADHFGQLDVHFLQGLLEVLHMLARVADQHLPLPQVGTQHHHVVVRPERRG
jgi:hypothetical protein